MSIPRSKRASILPLLTSLSLLIGCASPTVSTQQSPQTPSVTQSPSAPSDEVPPPSTVPPTPLTPAPQLGTGTFTQTDTVLSERTVSYTRETVPLAHKTVYLATDSLLEGQEQLQTQGHDGQIVYQTETVHIDGHVVSVTTYEAARTEAVDTVILRGTRPWITGIFRYPVLSSVTSPYGFRTLNGNREFHYGIDLRAPIGTPIAASDGGTIRFAGRLGGINASYGNLVIVTHPNGYETYYAHLDSISVCANDRIYQGQILGFSGITGKVTGPHLHFEIRKNGVTCDPLKLLQKD